MYVASRFWLHILPMKMDTAKFYTLYSGNVVVEQ